MLQQKKSVEAEGEACDLRGVKCLCKGQPCSPVAFPTGMDLFSKSGFRLCSAVTSDARDKVVGRLDHTRIDPLFKAAFP